MHCRAMLLVQKRQQLVVKHAPIAKAFAKANMDETTKAKLKRKFDVAYMIARKTLLSQR